MSNKDTIEEIAPIYEELRKLVYLRPASIEDAQEAWKLAQEHLDTIRLQAKEEGARETANAFGGCTKCYGKGYATVKDYSVGYEDFGGEGFRIENNPMRFCSCERGKQLSTLPSEKEV